MARTAAQIGRHFGVAARTVENWAASGAPIRLGKPNDLGAIARWKEARERERPNTQPDSEMARLRQAKLAAEVMEKTARAKSVQLRLRRAEGELIPVSEVEELEAERGSVLKRLFLSMPRRLAPALVGRSAAEIEQTLRSEIDRALRTLGP